MNSAGEEINRASFHNPALIKREKIRLKWFFFAWPAVLILFLCVNAIYFYARYDPGKSSEVSINGQGVSTEQMKRQDFEKWSAERIILFEKSLQNLQMRADMVQGELRSEAQQRIKRLKNMQTVAQVELSKLQKSDAALWSDAKREMTKILRDMKRAHYRVSSEITGFMF